MQEVSPAGREGRESKETLQDRSPAVHLCVFKIDTADKVKVMANSTSVSIYFTPGRFSLY